MPWNALNSAVITGLGLCLLVNTSSITTVIVAASVAIATKFLVRIKGKHIFDPASIGIVVALLFSGNAWVSPGQSVVHRHWFFGWCYWSNGVAANW